LRPLRYVVSRRAVDASYFVQQGRKNTAFFECFIFQTVADAPQAFQLRQALTLIGSLDMNIVICFVGCVVIAMTVT
jgi:hypothetical protein